MTEENHFPDEGMVDCDDLQGAGPPESPQANDHSGGVSDTSGAASGEVAPDPKVVELTADLQRLQAEYVNYKKRVDRDRELVLQNAKYSILSALLPVMDDLDRAREHGELEGGLKAIAESLEKIVEGQGLHKFGAAGDEFDPTRHEALMHGHSPDVTTSTCQNIVQAGYTIGDRVVRPALVTVVDPEPAAEADEVVAEESADSE